MVNFYEETIFTLECHGKTTNDILWIGKYVHDGITKFEHKGKTTDEFMRELFNFNYDNSYGGEVICTELMIVGKTDWWMDRREYDGSEWWEYHTKPSYPDTKIVSPVLKDILSDTMRGASTINNTSGTYQFDIDINVDEIANDYDVKQIASTIEKEIVRKARYRNVNAVSFKR